MFIETVQCGFPSPAADYKEDGLDFNDLIVRNPSATYCLRVSGHSMEGRGISPGDILVVDRSLRPRTGDVIVAALGGSFTVKTFVKKGGRIILQAANVDYEDIELEGDQELSCFGVVTCCLKAFRGNWPEKEHDSSD
ncbi:MAG: translesion error-prone DNA polymerase V autoproteolytic subunit [Spirochaetales bacterium]|nr:translesion error-prone DNA polymerase V autoproteolytic subunit [Spirochaetales bacterium]